MNVVGNKRYVTGWFSPDDPSLMVEFYELHKGVFEAAVVREGETIKCFNGNDLAQLESDMIDRFGGCIRAHVYNRTALPRARSL